MAGAAVGQPQPPTFNPLLAHSQGMSLGNSVVPDLMKIYESLTQSSTPHSTNQSAATTQFQHPAPPAPQTSYVQPFQNQNLYQQGTQASSQPSQTQYQYPSTTAAPTPGYYETQHFSQPHQQIATLAAAPTDKLPGQEASVNGRSLRKRASETKEDDIYSSDGSERPTKARKKGKSDGRWSKRFTWPDELHRDFVSAIFDVGLKHSSPNAILGHMPKHEDITSERIKSHLQKYRVHRAKSKNEFMSNYVASLSKFRSVGMGHVTSLAGGEVAAHLTYATTTETEEAKVPAAKEAPALASQTTEQQLPAGTLQFPRLTEAEKQSPIGASMGYLMGLFFSLRQQLMAQRAAVAPSEGLPVTGDHNNMPAQPYAMTVASHDSVHDPNAAAIDSQTLHPSAAGHQQTTNIMPTTSTSRTHLEESHLMMRDMQSSREIQNKMRALKQQELNKINRNFLVANHAHAGEGVEPKDGSPQSDGHAAKHDSGDGTMHVHQKSHQGAGETAEGGLVTALGKDRLRGLSIGGHDDFWVNDEQLFEFLMEG